MSDALIASLQKRIDDLTGENATLKGEAKDRRIKGKALADELAALKVDHARVAKERGEFEAAAKAAPDEWKGKYEGLQKDLVTRDHRDAFKGVGEFRVKVQGDDGKEVEKTFKLHDKASPEKVWAEVGYRAEGDAPSAVQVSEAYGKAFEAAPYLFSERVETTQAAPGGATNPGRPQAARPGPGAGRGSNDQPQPSALSAIQAGQASVGRHDIPGRL